MSTATDRIQQCAAPIDIDTLEHIPYFAREVGCNDRDIRRFASMILDGDASELPLTAIAVLDDQSRVLIDGYEAVLSAQAAGLDRIPALRLAISDRLAALKHAVELNWQEKRDTYCRLRITGLMLDIFDADELYCPCYGMGRRADHIAEALGISSRTAQRLIRIVNSPLGKIVTRVADDYDMSVGAAEKELVDRERHVELNPTLF